MKQITKIVILSDQNTTKAGKEFAGLAQNLLEKRGIETEVLSVDTVERVADALYQFDRIALEIKPDLLMVMDLACIGMQSPEEEPLFNNMTIPLVHVLFRRPWEYQVFMIWRCNFTDRFYMLVPEDVAHVRSCYPRILNVRQLPEGLFEEETRAVWGMEYEKAVLEQQYLALPDYMKKIAQRWKSIMQKTDAGGEEAALKSCLDEIGFACSREEYLDILYMMQSVFLLHNKHCYGDVTSVTLQEKSMEHLLEEFLETDFPVSLL